MNAQQRQDSVRSALRNSEKALADALRMIQLVSDMIPYEAPEAPPTLTIKAKEISEIVGLSEKNIVNRMSKAHGFPEPLTNRPKSWNRESVMEWIRTHKGAFIKY